MSRKNDCYRMFYFYGSEKDAIIKRASYSLPHRAQIPMSVETKHNIYIRKVIVASKSNRTKLYGEWNMVAY